MSFSDASLRWLEVVLFERYGYTFELNALESALQLSLPNRNGRIFFDKLQSAFHKASSDFACTIWNASEEGFDSALGLSLPAPGVDRLAAPLIEQFREEYVVHYDIIGLTYWMLSRLEEVGRRDLDSHQRFPAISSHAYQHGYLERPIVDEWLAILGQLISKQWPDLTLKRHEFSMKVSHDVDVPSRYGFRSAKGLVRAMAGDVLKRGDFKSALFAPWIWLNSSQRLHPLDPANTFDWIMDQSEQQGLTSAFYFICGRTDPSKDADYEPDHPTIRELMRRIHTRGHEIGLHPSYNTYQKPSSIVSEAKRLRLIMQEEGITQESLGGRMHYLRWEYPTTMRVWEEAGLNYDSTLSYADRPGFRCGTCHEYPAFDAVSQRQLQFRVRPLVVMECTVMAERYLGLGVGEAALEKMAALTQTCRAVGGCFTLLWHNSELMTNELKNMYREIIKL